MVLMLCNTHDLSRLLILCACVSLISLTHLENTRPKASSFKMIFIKTFILNRIYACEKQIHKFYSTEDFLLHSLWITVSRYFPCEHACQFVRKNFTSKRKKMGENSRCTLNPAEFAVNKCALFSRSGQSRGRLDVKRISMNTGSLLMFTVVLLLLSLLFLLFGII